MLKLNQAVYRFHAANAAYLEHRNSEFGQELRARVNADRYQAYLDSQVWIDSPLVKTLGVNELAELRAWGDEYTEMLNAFHARTTEIENDRLGALGDGLKVLGEMAGKAFHETSGPLDARINELLARADRLRKELLDGIGYVCVHDDRSKFGPAFYKHSGLTRRKMLDDMKAATEVRQGLRQVSASEYARLGFAAEEVCDESR